MNTEEALSAALGRRHGTRELRSAPDSASGFAARLRAVEVQAKAEGRDLRGLLGVSPQIRGRWRSGKSQPTALQQATVDALYRNNQRRAATKPRAAAAGGQRKAAAKPAPSRAKVAAVVSWNGYVNATPRRTVKLDGLDLKATTARWVAGDELGARTEFTRAVFERYGARVEFDQVTEFELS